MAPWNCIFKINLFHFCMSAWEWREDVAVDGLYGHHGASWPSNQLVFRLWTRRCWCNELFIKNDILSFLPNGIMYRSNVDYRKRARCMYEKSSFQKVFYQSHRYRLWQLTWSGCTRVPRLSLVPVCCMSFRQTRGPSDRSAIWLLTDGRVYVSPTVIYSVSDNVSAASASCLDVSDYKNDWGGKKRFALAQFISYWMSSKGFERDLGLSLMSMPVICITPPTTASIFQSRWSRAEAYNNVDSNGIKWNVPYLINRKSARIWLTFHTDVVVGDGEWHFISRTPYQITSWELRSKRFRLPTWMVILIDKHLPDQRWTVHVLCKEDDAKERDENEGGNTLLYVPLYALHQVTQTPLDDIVVAVYRIVVDDETICTAVHLVVFLLLMGWELS